MGIRIDAEDEGRWRPLIVWLKVCCALDDGGRWEVLGTGLEAFAAMGKVEATGDDAGIGEPVADAVVFVLLLNVRFDPGILSKTSFKRFFLGSSCVSFRLNR